MRHTSGWTSAGPVEVRWTSAGPPLDLRLVAEPAKRIQWIKPGQAGQAGQAGFLSTSALLQAVLDSMGKHPTYCGLSNGLLDLGFPDVLEKGDHF